MGALNERLRDNDNEQCVTHYESRVVRTTATIPISDTKTHRQMHVLTPMRRETTK